MSLEDLEVAGAAFASYSDYMDEYRASIVKAGHCDPNILGLIISDLVLEVDAVDICVAFNLQRGGVKFSVRSCVKEVNASELAAELSKGHWEWWWTLGKSRWLSFYAPADKRIYKILPGA